VERCPLCGGEELGILYPSNIPARRRPGDRYECTSFELGIHPDIYRCASCTFVFNEPASGAEDHLERYTRVDDPQYLEQRASRRATYGRELDRLEELCAGRELLDVGCYAGFFLEQARERGWRVAGVEPSKWAAAFARRELGLEVWQGPIEGYLPEDPARRFDLVTLWDVLEHLSDPLTVLRRLRDLLRPRGLLAFTTHNLDAPIARALRGRYPFFMEMHTVHLNDRTRDLLLDSTGFALVERHLHRRAVRLSYLLSRLRRFGETPARLAEVAAARLGLADRMLWIGFMGLETVIARPRGPGA
jgi:SAM-dependent methyltransferase